MIRKAHPSDSNRLTKLSIDSKSYWGYEEDEIKIFSSELQISEEYIYKNDVWVYEKDYKIIGYYSIQHQLKDRVYAKSKIPKGYWLDHLFIDPLFIGKGIGKELFNHFTSQCEQRNIPKVKILSDPNCSGFYEKMGAKHRSDFPSTIPNRTTPFLELLIHVKQSDKILNFLSTHSLKRVLTLFPIASVLIFLFINQSFDFTYPLIGTSLFAIGILLIITSFLFSIFIKKGLFKLVKFPLGFLSFLSLPILIFICLDILELIKNRGVDISFKEFDEITINKQTIRAYQTSGSNASDFWIVIREETTILPGFVRCKQIFREKNAGKTKLRKSENNSLNILMDDKIIKTIKIGK